MGCNSSEILDWSLTTRSLEYLGNPGVNTFAEKRVAAPVAERSGQQGEFDIHPLHPTLHRSTYYMKLSGGYGAAQDCTPQQGEC